MGACGVGGGRDEGDELTRILRWDHKSRVLLRVLTRG